MELRGAGWWIGVVIASVLAGLVGFGGLLAGVGAPEATPPVHAQVEPIQVFMPLALGDAQPSSAPSPLPPPSPVPATATASAQETPEPVGGEDQPGLYGISSSYAILEVGGDGIEGERRFHVGTGQTAFQRVQAVAGDFDGDGWDTIGLYDMRAGRFVLQHANTARAEETRFSFGEPFRQTDDGATVYALAGDWDGDGVDTVGLYDGLAHRFRLRNENTAGDADIEFVYGLGNVRPVVGDWDWDGIDTIGVFDPATGTAYLRNSNDAGAEDIVFASGRPGLAPVVGDFDGDGDDSIGVYGGDGMRFYLRDDLDASERERVVALGSRASIWAPLAGRWDVSGDTGEHTGFDWRTMDPENAGFDAERLAAAYDRAAAINNLHSLLVVRNGALVGEAYYGGYDASMANCLKSVSKSILSALYGLALEDGHLRGLEQPVSAFLPEYYQSDAEPRLGRTTINHLLTMRSGQDWTDPTHLGPMIVSEDWVGHVAGLPFTRDPGTRFTYNTGVTHVASTLLTRATGMATHEYAEERLFDPLGISATRWDVDPAGIDFGGAEVWMRPRDMARFGELYLRGGTIDDQRIIGADWVSRSTSAIVSASGPHTYGAWWWRRTFAEREVYFAWGYGGQFIFIVPELDLVVVTTSSWFRGSNATTNGPVFALLEEHILPAVVGD